MSSPPAFCHPRHNHQHCIDQALDVAEVQCRRNGARLTPQRRRVLEIIWSSHTPTGAYAILRQLATTGAKPAPMTVYRALDFLQSQGLVHRVAGLNAFAGCSDPGAQHDGRFLICSRCGTAAEIQDPALERALSSYLERADFILQGGRVELEGICSHCRGEPGA